MNSTTRRKIVSAKVTDAEKRRYPSKHYVYVIQVGWDDDSNTVIFRRYSRFFDFQIALLETFPGEAGFKDPSERIIPFLPGKILFRRSHVREVAMKRLKPIDEYCKELIRLPPHISASDHVLDFFESKPEDLHPPAEEASKRKRRDDQDIGEISGPILLEQYTVIADYSRVQSKELTVASGQLVEVIEKHENGWWFVSDEEGERGWVPGVYLEKPDGTSENLVTKQLELGYGEKYITTAQFTGGTEEVSFGSGVLVEVLQKNLEGWWYISYRGEQGWAPASYLEKPADAVLRQNNRINVVSSLSDMRDHRRSLPAETTNVVIPVPSQNQANSQVKTAISSPRRHPSLSKTNSNPSASQVAKHVNSFSQSKPTKVLPPPKRSSVNKSPAISKPQIPPPSPPSTATSQEPVYEYFTTTAFEADIPHSISFKQDKKVKVLEKSPGDWWFISLDDREGWAPASHIKKEFVQKKTLAPPNRPKPPSAVYKPSLPKQQETNVYNNINKPSQNEMSTSINSSKSSSQPQRPLLPVSTSIRASNCSGEPAEPRNGLTTHQMSERNVASKPKPPLKTQKNFSNKIEDSSNAPVDFRTVLKPAVASKTRQASSQPTLPTKPVPKPDSASNKFKPIVPTPAKPPVAKNSSVKQQAKPPPPVPGSKKPLVPRKDNIAKPSTVKKPSFLDESNQVDFRSVLKSSKNTTSNHGVSPKTSGNPVKKPPMLPVKPSVSSKPVAKFGVASRYPSDMTNGANSAALKTNGSSNILKNGKRPAMPGSKPVLRRFQADKNFSNRNDNNNSETEKSVKKDFIVNRVESDFIVPGSSLPFTLRGSPDGQVDSFVSNDSSKEKKLAPKDSTQTTVVTTEESCSELNETKYIAVADFAPEDPKEMGFAQGDIATLLEVAKNDWWYVQIEDDSGWVPCSYFRSVSSPDPEGQQRDAEPNINVEGDSMQQKCSTSDAAEDSLGNDAVYSEIADEFYEEKDCNNLYQAGSGFGATDATMISLAFGDVLQVLDRTDTGWWYARVYSSSITEIGKEGWVPSEYLDKL